MSEQRNSEISKELDIAPMCDDVSEFAYYAAALIFGKRSPKMKKFSVYSLDTFRRYKDIELREASGMVSDSSIEISRHLIVDNRALLETSHTEMVSETNRIVTVFDHEQKVRVSDALFSDLEFKQLGSDWNNMVESKIKTFSILLKAMYFRKISSFPLLVCEYPNIAKSVFSHPDFWMSPLA